MPFIITIVVIALLAVLIGRSRNQPDEASRRCLDDLLMAIRKKPDIKASELASILRAHGFDRSNANTVTRLIKPRLQRTGIRKDEQAAVLHEVGRAKHLV